MNEKMKIISILSKGFIELNQIVVKSNISKKMCLECLDQLVNDNIVYHKPNTKQYGLIKTGKVDIKSAGYGFVLVDGEEEDYYISPYELKGVYDGDTILFYPVDEYDKHLCARTIKVIDRAHKTIIGKYKRKVKNGTARCYIISNNPDFNVKVHTTNEKDIEDGMIVVGNLKYHGDNTIHAKIVEVLGKPNDPGIEISQIALEHGFDHNFSEEIESELSSINDVVTEEDKIGRYDFTDRLIFTIDGDDSKDFDDAVDIIKNKDGSYRLGVYIADVSHYVKENSELDKTALAKGTSVYLADRVIPMLPFKLSNGICSLNPNVERLALACIMEISKEGNLTNYEICECVIKSKYRMTYSNVNKIIDGDLELEKEYYEIVPSIMNMVELSEKLRRIRNKKGALEFDVPEYKFDLNLDGSPKDIILRDREKAEKLIEDFMLMANETVAYNMNIMSLPCVYRIHEKPEQEKLKEAFMMLNKMGVSVELPKKDIKPKQLQEALDKIEESPIKPILSNVLLRSMMKAKYSHECLGHYGLAMHYYCHFTSPIRRYPDLMTHRIIKRVLINPKNLEGDLTHFNQILPSISDISSKQERKAIECERAVNDMLSAWYMQKYRDKFLDGTITSVTSFGMFVTLENGIEGLVSLNNLIDYFDYDSYNMSYSNGDITYKLGDKVTVVVLDADRKSRKIDFMFKEDYLKWRNYNEGYLYK